MFSYKILIFIALICPLVASLTLTEEIFLTRQLVKIFGDDFEEENSQESNLDETKSAALISDTAKEREHHYWTRKGHQTRERNSQNATEIFNEYYPRYGINYRKKRSSTTSVDFPKSKMGKSL